MAERTKISVVIPVYNEVATIGRVIERVLDCGFDPEIIVVDDASTDGTAKFLREFSHPQVRCFFHSDNRGKGAALRLGFAAAKNPYVFVQDADLEYDPRDYARDDWPDARRARRHGLRIALSVGPASRHVLLALRGESRGDPALRHDQRS